MKQIVFKAGQAICIEVPPPQIKDGQLLVDVRSSCISTGTEMTGLSSSGKTLLQKAKENPEKLKAALVRMKTEGIFSVLNKAQSKQENEILSGYSASGIVKDFAPGVLNFSKGMRVAIAGAGYANHAELAVVPVNLAMPIPDDVSLENASTCALGGIALQGIRRADVTIGDYVVVLGCGAIGLLTVQMLKAAGCRVIGIDLEDTRLNLASDLGAEFIFNPNTVDVVRKVIHATDGQGADRVIVTVAASSAEPLQQAFSMSRRKGRVVLVGVTGMELDRGEMYRKELDFVLSTSYGPGRYDEKYEKGGIDYPYAYVRWTEKRNMQAYLQLIADGSVKLDRIIGKSYPVEQVEEAYSLLMSNDHPLLLLLAYSPHEDSEMRVPSISLIWNPPSNNILKVGLVGVGSFVQGMHIPNIRSLKDRFSVKALCDLEGIATRKAARLLPDSDALIETDYEKFLQADINMVLIGTRHNTHASLAIRALEAGKAVFVEKPLCITREEFSELMQAIHESEAPYMVGYNRRFAPAIKKVRNVTDNRINPLMITYTVNGGYIPYDSWVHTEEGGGRIIGEACHIFDLFRSLTGSEAATVSINGISPNTGSVRSSDNVIVTIKYNDGSVCSLIYTSLGSKEAFKERMEVFCDEQTLILYDYMNIESFGVDCKWKSKRPEKGHLEELEFFHNEIMKGNRFPIPLDELEETWLISRQVADQLTV